jgi:hypothetical protein
MFRFIVITLTYSYRPVGLSLETSTFRCNASTEDEWLDRLGRLVESPELRRRIGQAARQTIADHYSVQVWAPRFRDILLQAVSGKVNKVSHLSHAAPENVP